MQVQHEGKTYSTQCKIRTVEVTVPPPVRDWTPIGNPLMLDAKKRDAVELKSSNEDQGRPTKNLPPQQGKKG